MFPDFKSAGKTAEIVCFMQHKKENQYTKIRKTMHRNVFTEIQKTENGSYKQEG